jgi:quercetin dioxygenase-like cupin family protein
MEDDQKESHRPESETATPAARHMRPLADPVLTFDFTAEAEMLRTEGPWLQHGRNAVTLAKYDDFRIVFMLMKPGTRLQDHHASGRISVHTLSGRVRLHLEERAIELPAGHLLALEREVPHDLEAIEESAVLLTIAWPGESK